MKIRIIVTTLACSVCLLSACTGGKSTRVSKDTGDRYGVKPDDTSKIDTSKAKSSDYSGSGGAKIDSPKKPK